MLFRSIVLALWSIARAPTLTFLCLAEGICRRISSWLYFRGSKPSSKFLIPASLTPKTEYADPIWWIPVSSLPAAWRQAVHEPARSFRSHSAQPFHDPRPWYEFSIFLNSTSSAQGHASHSFGLLDFRVVHWDFSRTAPWIPPSFYGTFLWVLN